MCKSCQIHSWRVFLQNKHISGNRHAHLPSQLASLQLVGMSDRSGFVISAEDGQEGHKSELVPFSGGGATVQGLPVGSRKGSIGWFTTGKQTATDPMQQHLQVNIYSTEPKAVCGFVRLKYCVSSAALSNLSCAVCAYKTW